MIAFLIALVTIGGLGIAYYILRQRKKNKQLERAVAEGKVTLRPMDELTDGNEDSPDKGDGIEM